MDPIETPQANDRELLRFTFCSITIATFLTSLVAGQDLRSLINPGGFELAIVVLGLSAAFAFIYLLSVAAHLKYQGSGYIDRFAITFPVGRFFYDASINVFGFYFVVLAAQWIATHLFHVHSIWPVVLIVIFGSGIIYLLALPLWMLLTKLLTGLYYVRQREDELHTRKHIKESK